MSAQDNAALTVVVPPQVDIKKEVDALLDDMDGSREKLYLELEHASKQALLTGKKAIVTFKLEVIPPKDDSQNHVSIYPSIKTNIPDLPPSSALRFIGKNGTMQQSDKIQTGMFEEKDEPGGA